MYEFLAHFFCLCNFGCCLRFLSLLQTYALHISAKSAIFRCTSWSYKVTGTATGFFLGWYYIAATRLFSVTVLLVEFLFCFGLLKLGQTCSIYNCNKGKESEQQLKLHTDRKSILKSENYTVQQDVAIWLS
jgi:hypothetical protein